MLALQVQPFSFPPVLSEGDDASVTCIAKSKSKQVSFKWLKDGHEFREESQRVLVSNLGGISTLIINGVRAEDAANYTCQASVGSSSDSFTSPLIVAAAPKWLKEPHDQIVGLNDEAMFDCLTISSPPARTSWFINGQAGETQCQKVRNFCVLNFTFLLACSLIEQWIN